MKIQTPILVVDDDADVRDMTRDVLEIAGYYHVAEASDGLEAMQFLRDSLAPTIVLCDFQMPRQNGLQMIDALTREPEHVPRHVYVLMTANESLLSPEQRALLERQAVPILRKPFELDELIEIIDNAVARLQEDSPLDALGTMDEPSPPNRIPSSPTAQ